LKKRKMCSDPNTQGGGGVKKKCGRSERGGTYKVCRNQPEVLYGAGKKAKPQSLDRPTGKKGVCCPDDKTGKKEPVKETGYAKETPADGGTKTSKGGENLGGEKRVLREGGKGGGTTGKELGEKIKKNGGRRLV